MDCKGLTEEHCVPPCKYVNGEKRKYCMTSKIKAMRKSVKKPKSLEAKDCKGLSRENCLEPECKYINGEKRKYCMNSKKQAKTLKIPLNLEKAKNKIGNFMLKKRHNITSHFLTKVCNDSGVCIAFGKETEKIKNFFDHFVFNYKQSMKELSKGANGIVYEIEYERLNYKAYTIMKTAQKRSSDNLIYEYLVGMLFINKFYKKFPCFLETYNWCLMPTIPNPPFFSTSLDLKLLIKTSCKIPTDVGIQVEYLKSPKTIKSVLHTSLPFWSNDLLQVLFQVYFPLAILGDTFTHYDLHYNNVLLYVPVADHYIQYHYHGTETITFKTQYITKIIDYGRCHFKIDGINSLLIREEVCITPDCNKKTVCGNEIGYGFLKRANDKDLNHINSSVSNTSHDLRLLYYVSQFYTNVSASLHSVYDTFSKQKNGRNTVDTFFENIIYSGPKKGGHVYGTKQIKTKGYPKKCNNINDAVLFLINICSSPGFKIHNDTCYNDPSKKLGDLLIYSDGRNMEFRT